MKSKILIDQIKKCFNTSEFESDLNELSALSKNINLTERQQNSLKKMAHLGKFIEVIDNTYFQLESEIKNHNPHFSIDSLVSSAGDDSVSTINNNHTPSSTSSKNEADIEIDSLLNTLDDGYLIISRDNAKIELASSIAKKILDKDPSGDHLVNIISIPKERKDSFQEWLNMVFMEVIPFNELVRLAPKGFQFGTRDKLIDVKFKPIRSLTDGRLLKIAMILHDNSSIFETEKIINEQKLFTDMIVKYLNDKPNFIRAIHNTRETADTLNSWTFNTINDIQEQSKIVSDKLHNLKVELNNFSVYSLGYKIHQIEDEIINFFSMKPLAQDGENLIHLLGQEINDSLNDFLNKYRHIFIFDSKLTQTKEIPVENIYKFCGELLRMGLTDLLKYYIDEIVVVPFASLFAPIEAKVYAQSLNQDSYFDYSLTDPKNIRVVPEFYSYFFEQLGPVFSHILSHRNDNAGNQSKIEITIDLNGDPSPNTKILISIKYSIITKNAVSSILTEKAETLISTLIQSINHVGGNIEVQTYNENSLLLNIYLPYVSEINSDMMNWLSSGGPEAGKPIRAAS